jgi:hypothetical protein
VTQRLLNVRRLQVALQVCDMCVVWCGRRQHSFSEQRPGEEHTVSMRVEHTAPHPSTPAHTHTCDLDGPARQGVHVHCRFERAAAAAAEGVRRIVVLCNDLRSAGPAGIRRVHTCSSASVRRRECITGSMQHTQQIQHHTPHSAQRTAHSTQHTARAPPVHHPRESRRWGRGSRVCCASRTEGCSSSDVGVCVCVCVCGWMLCATAGWRTSVVSQKE